MRRISSIIRSVVCVVIAAGVVVSGLAGVARAVGEPVNGFPNWAERVIHEWINRARVDPQLEMTACTETRCVEHACYGVMPPLTWSQALNRSARFHSDEMVRQGYFAHSSTCPVVANINSLYPDSCNGSAACACTGSACSTQTPCTDFAARVQLFGGNPSGEIIASPSDPNQSFYLWLYEQGDTSTCQFTGANGHRWLILKSTASVGLGVAGYSTGDFGSGSAPTKIPSGSHYPRQSTSVAAWANWYDAAGPSSAAVNVDGTCTPMTLQRGTQTNGAWSATLTGFASGCHRYYFSFVDSGGALVTYPTTGSLAIGSGASCPDWDSARPAPCGAGGATATATPPATSTPPPTATAIASSTRTPTRTATVPTPTASATNTRTLTPTPSASPTATPVPPTRTATPTVLLSGENIAGSLRYYSNDQPVPGITVSASGVATAASDASGHYLLVNVPAENVVVEPSGASGPGTAVGSLDASWVLQAVAGMRQFSPQQRLACDVSGNGSLSSLDATYILQYAVGLIDRLPVATACDSDWAFLPNPAPAPSQTLIQPQPSANGCTPGGIAFGAISGSLDDQSFTAVRFGDCTGNWQPPAAGSALRAGSALLQRQTGTLRPLRGDRVALPITIESTAPVQAVDVRVTYDATALRVVHSGAVGTAQGALVVSNDAEPGVLRIAIASATAIVADGRPSAVVVFDVLRGDHVPPPSIAVRLDGE